MQRLVGIFLASPCYSAIVENSVEWHCSQSTLFAQRSDPGPGDILTSTFHKFLRRLLFLRLCMWPSVGSPPSPCDVAVIGCDLSKYPFASSPILGTAKSLITPRPLPLLLTRASDAGQDIQGEKVAMERSSWTKDTSIRLEYPSPSSLALNLVPTPQSLALTD